jgi:hypothetical protein
VGRSLTSEEGCQDVADVDEAQYVAVCDHWRRQYAVLCEDLPHACKLLNIYILTIYKPSNKHDCVSDKTADVIPPSHPAVLSCMTGGCMPWPMVDCS